MKLRMKKRTSFGVKRISVDGKIEKIEKSVNPMNPGHNGLTLFFKGLEGMGAISFSPEEVLMLAEKTLKKKQKNPIKAKKVSKKKI